MQLEQRQFQTQKQIMAPVMQQSIEVLLLPIVDLEQAIDQELESNPLLENQEETPDSGGSEFDKEKPFRETLSDEIQHLMNAPNHPHLSTYTQEEDYESNPVQSNETLEQKLLCQLHVDIDDPLKIRIGEMIIGQLDVDGYLTLSCQEIVQALSLSSVKPVQEVLSLIQSYEPYGIAARDLTECLLIQTQVLLNGNAPLVTKIIQNHLEDLGRKRHDLIAKNLKIPIDHVKHCAHLIATLEPKPARNFRPISQANYVKPDIFIYKNPDHDNEYVLEVNEKGIPLLRINPAYRKLLLKKNLTAKEKEFLKEKLQNAVAFIKSIQQRGSTIKEIGSYLLEQQKKFFVEGHLALKPMGLKDVAKALNRNESTISRAISQKYIDTPQGIFPLKYFFSQSVGEHPTGCDGVASRSVKEEIHLMVDEEDKQHPLSDQKIQQLLKHQGMNVARRTIGKYRKQLNILPSHLRKE